MRWKSVVLAGLLIPAGAGCNIAKNAARNIINEPHVVWTLHAIHHDLRREARAAWEENCGQYPHCSAEFRDGFIDGYVDYLDRGGNGSLPAIPPARYTRHKKYFTEEGHCLLKEYFLGFKSGQEVAIATGRRQFLTVPVLLPNEPTGPPAFTITPHAETPRMEYPEPPVLPEPPPGEDKKEMPVSAVRPAPNRAPRSLPAGLNTAPPPVPKPDPARVPVPALPLPQPAKPAPAGPAAWGNLPAIPSLPAAGQALPLPTIPALPVTAASETKNETKSEAKPANAPNFVVPKTLPPNHPLPQN